MTATMGDRGPDACGSWSQGRVALGHRRLKIIDLTDASSQPMVDPASGIAGVFGGALMTEIWYCVQAFFLTFVASRF